MIFKAAGRHNIRTQSPAVIDLCADRREVLHIRVFGTDQQIKIHLDESKKAIVIETPDLTHRQPLTLEANNG